MSDHSFIPLCVPQIEGNEWQYVKECLDTTWVSSGGAFVNRFEEEFRAYLGCRNAVAVVNGTAALHLALVSLGIGPGDEVIVPSMTFVAPVNAVRYTGADPVFCDVRRDTFVLDEEKIEQLITPRTKAIMPVHIYGQAVEMDALMKIAGLHGLRVIEDATEALGGGYRGQKLGTIGDMGCFSFNGNKIMTTGGGGMLVTNNTKWGAKARYLSTQSKTVMANRGFFHDSVGYNYRLPNILAAMGVAQLEKLPGYLIAKRSHAALYNQLLKEIPGLTLPPEPEGVTGCFWLYSPVVEAEYGRTRDQLIQLMLTEKVETRPFFQPVHQMPPYRECRCGDLKVTSELARKGINLPSSVGLKEDQIIRVAELVKKYRG